MSVTPAIGRTRPAAASTIPTLVELPRTNDANFIFCFHSIQGRGSVLAS
jgi:hypothetical protein